MKSKAAPLVLLVLLTLASYSNTLHSPFHFDDLHQITGNANVRDLANIPRFFYRGGMTSYTPELSVGYRPVTFASFAAGYALSGYHVEGYHLVNILLHLLNALMVYLIVGRVMRAAGVEKRLVPLVSAAVFAVHPIQTGAVTYISGRALLLASLFSLVSLAAFMDFRRGGRGRHAWGAVSVLSYALGLLSKETAICLPLLVAAYDIIFIMPDIPKKERVKKAAAYVPYVLLTLAYLAAREAVVGYAVVHDRPYGILAYMLSELRVFLMYLRLMFLPVNQNADYALPAASSVDARAVVSALIIIVTAVLLYRARKDKKALAFFGCWFLLALAPESSLVPISDIAVEYRLYIPSAGLVAAVLISLMGVLARPAGKYAAAAAVCLLCVLTLSRNAVWASEYALWRDVARKSPGSPRAHLNLGKALMDDRRYHEAIAELGKALEIAPFFDQAYSVYNDLGCCYVELGMYDKGVVHLKKAADIYQGCIEAYGNLGSAYLRMGRPGEAEKALKVAVGLDPSYASAHYTLALVYSRTGRIHEAISELEAAARLSPKDFRTHISLAELYLSGKMPEKALIEARRASSLADGGAEEEEAGKALKNAGG